MSGSNFPNPPGFYQYSRKFRVDLEGNGDFQTIKDACDASALITPRDILTYVLIDVNAGVYIEEPFDIPDWVILRGVRNVRNFPGTIIARGLSGTLPSSDTHFITMGERSVLENCVVITTLVAPANFDTQYAVVDSIGGGATVSGCWLGLSGTYNGANRAYGFLHTSGVDQPTLKRTEITVSGTGGTSVKSGVPMGIYYCELVGFPEIHIELSHTDLSIPSTLMHSRLISLEGSPTGVSSLYDINLTTATTGINLFSTRVPLNKRGGTGVYNELHPTPQQLSTAKTASNRTVDNTDSVAVRTADAYTDGTIEADSSAAVVTVFAPVFANAINGQEFTYKRVGANTVTLDGNGVLIDGLATQDLTTDLQSYTISKNDRGSWSII